MTEQQFTILLEIVAGLAGVVTLFVGVVARSMVAQMKRTTEAWQKQVAETQSAEIALRKQDALDRVEESRANRAVLTQLLSFMAALNENMRRWDDKFIAALTREPLRVVVDPSTAPVPTVPAREGQA